jgi:eukaryotic-like serine/threonine-protein kinase
MGAVYRARDISSGQGVAVKVMTRHGVDDAARFYREAEMLRRLDHPRIVRYVAHGVTARGELFLAMEWLEGEDLEARLERGPLSLSDSLRLARGTAEALAAAHALGIVHRDVKPSNLLLISDDMGEVKVVDFGVAQGPKLTTFSTEPGSIVGTPAYMAPEQLRGSGDVDARADVYSLGCVLFECLAGRPTFVGAHAIAVLAKILVEEAPRLADLCEEVPELVDELVASMLSKDASGRPADGAAIVRALAAIDDREALRRASPSVESPALSRGEQQLLSVVLARGPRRVVDADGPTFLSAPERARRRAEGASSASNGEAGEDARTLTDRGSPVDDALRQAVEPFQGRVERLVDGSVVATLVGQGAATDQAARGARCALSLRALLPGVPLSLATGRGIVAGHLPLGEVIDRAAALVSDPSESAHARSVRVDDVTAGLLDEQFEVTGDAHGLWLLGERKAIQPVRKLLGKPTPCVGRERELALLLGVFDECVAEAAPRVVLVTAPAGVGKSRLRYEFVRKLASRETPIGVMMSRGDPMRAGAPFVMIAPLVRYMAGVIEGEPLETRQRKLAARVARNVDVRDRQRVTEFLGELIGTPFPDEDSVQLRVARREPLVMGDQMKSAWEDFLVAEKGDRPFVVVLEDLHWGDLSSVSFVDSALRVMTAQPCLFLALARPEVRTLFPSLWADREVIHVELTGLSRRASERLVREVLGEGVADRAVDRIVDQAMGNAFYLEELIRAVAAGKGDALPGTVLAMAQARLEEFDPARRRLLRAASIFGQTFWQGGVAALLGAEAGVDVDRLLHGLVEDEMIATRETSRFALEREYIFRHALVREAAYGMLTNDDRAKGHRAARGWLERVGEGDSMVLAEHGERGGEPATATLHYLNAARQALGGNDFAAVIARAERCVACGASGAVLGAARLLEVIANHWHGTVDECARCASEAILAFREGEAGWFEAMGWSVWASARLGQLERAKSLVEQMRAVTPDPDAVGASLVALCRATCQLVLVVGDYATAVALMPLVEDRATLVPREPQFEAFVSRTRAFVASLTSGDLGECAAHFAAAAASFERAGDARNGCIERINTGNVYMYLGADELAAGALREGYGVAVRLTLRRMKAYASFNIGILAARRGEMDQARTSCQSAVDEYLALGDRAFTSIASSYLAQVLAHAGDLEGAGRAARQAMEASESQPVERVFAFAVAALVDLLRGDAAEALARARAAKGWLDSLGRVEDGEQLTRLVYAEALRATDAKAEWREAIANARESLLARAGKIRDPALRESFLQVPENRRTLELEAEARAAVAGTP